MADVVADEVADEVALGHEDLACSMHPSSLSKRLGRLFFSFVYVKEKGQRRKQPKYYVRIGARGVGYESCPNPQTLARSLRIAWPRACILPFYDPSDASSKCLLVACLASFCLPRYGVHGGKNVHPPLTVVQRRGLDRGMPAFGEMVC